MKVFQPGAPIRAWLSGAASLYGLAVRASTWAYDCGWRTPTRLPCRVVSVGNLTVGGTGKTPMVILLTEWLLEEGRKVAVLSRGYKRESSDAFVLVSDGRRVLVGPAAAGDEPYLIATRCPKAIVAVGADRAAAGRRVLSQEQVDCIVLDDGFQHRRLARDLDVVLLDAMDATGLDALLPAGRLREPLSGLRRAGAVVITRADSSRDVAAVHARVDRVLTGNPVQADVVFTADSVASVSTGERRPLDWCVGRKAWLVSGIGNSDSFRRVAMASGVQVLGETAFVDHHAYRREELHRVRTQAGRAQAEIVLTTEKDAGKLAPLLNPGESWWALRLRADVVRGMTALRRLVCGSPTQTGRDARA